MTQVLALLVLALFATPARLAAQRTMVAEHGHGVAARLVDSVVARPHVVPAGSGIFALARDSSSPTTLLVIGRAAYIAGHVHGDVVVVGGDLFLRPGADVSGRAVAIGGTVSESSLGRVGGGVLSLRDETLDVTRNSGDGSITFAERSLRPDDETPGVFRLAGIRGLMLPRYDRVDGLSLPVGVQFVLDSERVVVEPSITYRSRLGVLDPAVGVRLGPEEGTRVEGRIARDTRTNDGWITPDILNSLLTLGFGTDTRNYFRSDIGEGRVFLRRGGERAMIEPFVGGRFERVSPISSAGNVYSFFRRSDSLATRRPNPLVESGDIGSALLGVRYQRLPADTAVTVKLAVQAEQSFTAPSGTSNFTQFAFDGLVGFPTFGPQHLRVAARAVGTRGDAVPRARYAYVGGSRTLGLSDLLQFGGTALLFVDSRYYVPLPSVQLPVVGPPTVSFIDKIGGAGVKSLSPLQQEVGVGLGLGPVTFEFLAGASGQGRTSFGISLNFPSF